VSSNIALLWFRSDLRLDDNPALTAAVESKSAVVPVFVWCPEEEQAWAPGAASRWWLAQSLRDLDARLRAAGSRLILARGPSLPTLLRLAEESGANAVYWNRRYEPASIARDEASKRALTDRGIAAHSFNASLLFEPWTITKSDGTPYQVFSAFYRACLARRRPADPLAAPRSLPAPQAWPLGLGIDALALEPASDWTAGLRAAWTPGEAGAADQLTRFLDGPGAETYEHERDRPDHDGTSRLSPHFHFGEIGPRRLWHAAGERIEATTDAQLHRSTDAWLRQLVWREFAYHLLYWFPHTTNAPLRREFATLPWADDAAHLRAWQRGLTGYPIVDAGMRQLWATGWMHNRVRMIVASFLVKDLLLPWQQGSRWFWDTLVDADLANNTLGWQWTAGCGADAAPFFRVFNPVLQGRKFDPDGVYVRRWVPELAHLGRKWIHEPWRAPQIELDAAGVTLGAGYPRPIVAHDSARRAALTAYARIGARGREAGKTRGTL